MNELDKIKLKIKALAAKTVSNGCSEHEAMSAMQGVGRLLAHYHLTMDECDVRTSPCRTIFIDIGRTHRHPIDSCVTALANLVNAKCWFARHYGKYKPSAYAFFGQENDLELIEYLFRVIHAAIDHEAETFKQSDDYTFAGFPNGRHGRRSAYVSFQRGMACRIGRRLHELKIQNDIELARTRPTGSALIVLQQQLVEDEFRRHGPKLRNHRGGWHVSNQAAFNEGGRAGNKVNLSRPLRGGSKVGGLLS